PRLERMFRYALESAALRASRPATVRFVAWLRQQARFAACRFKLSPKRPGVVSVQNATFYALPPRDAARELVRDAEHLAHTRAPLPWRTNVALVVFTLIALCAVLAGMFGATFFSMASLEISCEAPELRAATWAVSETPRELDRLEAAVDGLARGFERSFCASGELAARFACVFCLFLVL